MQRSRIHSALIGGILTAGLLGPFAPHAQGQSLPPAILDCTRLQDALQRLECFDRQVARYGHPPGPVVTMPTPAIPPPPAPTASHPSAAPVAASGASGAPAPPPRHIRARIRDVRPSSDGVEVTLDNGEVWEQTLAVDTRPNLQPGEVITIDRQLGSYWLSDAGGTSIQVRERH